ncbi:hypothetical protein Patl1_12443 [Pistacia atlantica]|uniref:Uncharacterized protein n=1 Tax=Pistacia atlantica TaxID=434234 RepID=A0ACC1AUX8_9ROSI|nr:hypothetical protein Patl1_12443 [Pistacia atlantica]
MRNLSSLASLLYLGFYVQRGTYNKKVCTNVLRCYSRLSSPKPLGPLMQYKKLIEEGKLQHDPNQERIALALENLLGRLEQYEKDMEGYHVNLANWEKKRENERRKILMEEAKLKQQGDLWGSVNKHQNKILERWMFRKKPKNVEPGVGKWVSYLNRERKLDSLVGQRPTAPPAPKGLYIYGNVGSGKTMLMDMFYCGTEGIVKHRRRLWKNQVEENSLQSSISNWITSLPFDMKVKEWVAAEERYKQDVQIKNILPAVADKFLVEQHAEQRGASVLCFDEIQDGMHRELFQKFVSKLEKHCEIIAIGSEIDYRRLIAQRSIDQVHYFWPLDGNALRAFETTWEQVTIQLGGKITSHTIRVMFGRTLEVPQSCNGVARLTFEYLCGRPVGAADYIAVAQNYHTVFISDIPVMSMRIRDKARRFITLIDELYNYHCCLVCSAASSIDDLFQGTEEGTLFDLESFQFETEIEGGKLRQNVLAEGSVSSGGAPAGIVSMLSGQEEMFAFRRAVSRLIEMQTPLYLEGVHSLHPFFQSKIKSM